VGRTVADPLALEATGRVQSVSGTPWAAPPACLTFSLALAVVTVFGLSNRYSQHMHTLAAALDRRGGTSQRK
jgi:hypothetical protein